MIKELGFRASLDQTKKVNCKTALRIYIFQSISSPWVEVILEHFVV